MENKNIYKIKKTIAIFISLMIKIFKSIFHTYKYIILFCLFLGLTNPSIFGFSLESVYFFGKLFILGIVICTTIIIVSLIKTQNVKDFRMPNDLIKEMKNGTEEIISKEFRKYSEEDKRRVRMVAIENNYTVGRVKYYYVFKKI